jgi:hypothetical protein
MRTHATRRQKLFWGLHIACTLPEHCYLAAAHCYAIATEETLSYRRLLAREKSRGYRRGDQCASNVQRSTAMISAIPSPIAPNISQQMHFVIMYLYASGRGQWWPQTAMCKQCACNVQSAPQPGPQGRTPCMRIHLRTHSETVRLLGPPKRNNTPQEDGCLLSGQQGSFV